MFGILQYLSICIIFRQNIYKILSQHPYLKQKKPKNHILPTASHISYDVVYVLCQQFHIVLISTYFQNEFGIYIYIYTP